MALFLVNVFAQQYVDLGLESGTLWKDQNEKGFYTYQEAERNFGNSMPTAPQLNELVNTCVWEWTDNGYKITGPNGKSIFLPAEGYYSCGADPKLKRVGTSGQYWSKTMTDYIMANNPEDWDFPYCLTINSESKSVHYNNPECCKFTIRLVFEDEKAALKSKTQNQLAEGNEKAKSEAAEQRKQEEEQKKLENQKKLEEEAKRKAEEEDKRLEAQCVSLKDIDGNKYKLVKIGTQCWMAENLRTTHYADGTEIPQYNNKSLSKYDPCYFNPHADSQSLSLNGLLYNWRAATKNCSSSQNPSNVQGACPHGWHVPSNAEWIQLIDYLKSQPRYCYEGKKNKIAKALAVSTGWKTPSGNKKSLVGIAQNENNKTGFTAVPSGIGWYMYSGLDNSTGWYKNIWVGEIAMFWTSTIKESYARTTDLWCKSERLRQNGFSLHFALSVRCVRGAVQLSEEELALRTQAFLQKQASRAQTAKLLFGTLLSTTELVLSMAMASSLQSYGSTSISDYPSSSGSSDISSSSESSWSHYEPIGTATGIKITESGDVSHVSYSVEKDKNTGSPNIVINGTHYQLVRNTTSSCNGVSVSQYSYVCHVTHGSRILYTVFVNF